MERITPELMEGVFDDIALPSEQSIGQSERNHERLLDGTDPFIGSKWKVDGAKEKHGTRQSAMMKKRVNDPEYKAYLIDQLAHTWNDPELKERHAKLMTDRMADPEYKERFRKLRSENMKERYSDTEVRKAVGVVSKAKWDVLFNGMRDTSAYSLCAQAVTEYSVVVDPTKKGYKADICRLIDKTLHDNNIVVDQKLYTFIATETCGVSGVYARKYYKDNMHGR